MRNQAYLSLVRQILENACCVLGPYQASRKCSTSCCSDYHWKLSLNPSYLRFLRTSAERNADPGSVAVRANAEGGKESTKVQSQMRHFPLEKGNTVMPSGRLPSQRSRPTGSRTALKPADDKARLMMSFKAECRGFINLNWHFAALSALEIHRSN